VTVMPCCRVLFRLCGEHGSIVAPRLIGSNGKSNIVRIGLINFQDRLESAFIRGNEVPLQC